MPRGGPAAFFLYQPHTATSGSEPHTARVFRRDYEHARSQHQRSPFPNLLSSLRCSICSQVSGSFVMHVMREKGSPISPCIPGTLGRTPCTALASACGTPCSAQWLERAHLFSVVVCPLETVERCLAGRLARVRVLSKVSDCVGTVPARARDCGLTFVMAFLP